MSLIDTIRRVRRSPIRQPSDAASGPAVPLKGARVLLVYLFPALGDGVLLAPAAAALLEAGAASVSVLVRKNVARILAEVDLPIDLIVLPDRLAVGKAELDRADDAPAAELDKLGRKLAKKHFDVAVDLTFRADNDGRRFVAMTAARARLGWTATGEDLSQAGLTHGVADVRYQGERHWSRYQMLPLAPLGIENPRWPVRFVADAKADKVGKAHFAKDGPRVLLVPGARDQSRRFPSVHFEALGRFVIEALGGSVVIAGAPDEAKLARSIAKALGDRAEIYVKKDLGVLLALIKCADAVVTNDTGPMHFAFLAERPTIAIFTSMSPVCWGPATADPRFVVINAGGRALEPSRASMYARAAQLDLERLLGRRIP